MIQVLGQGKHLVGVDWMTGVDSWDFGRRTVWMICGMGPWLDVVRQKAGFGA
jgi:hypothetical protein